MSVMVTDKRKLYNMKFSNLRAGDFFEYQGDIWVKTLSEFEIDSYEDSYEISNAVQIGGVVGGVGYTLHFLPNDDIVWLENIEVVIN